MLRKLLNLICLVYKKNQIYISQELLILKKYTVFKISWVTVIEECLFEVVETELQLKEQKKLVLQGFCSDHL